MRTYKIIKLSWVTDDYNFAVVYRSPGTGWIYLAKYISRADADKLIKEV